ncbi:MAG: hypothetical protein U0228_00015 [Myxococcaceae bacterium]
MLRVLSVVSLLLALPVLAKKPPPKATPVGAALVEKLAAVTGDRLKEFAPALGDVSAFPGTAPQHDAAVAEFEKKLATTLGVKGLKLDTVRNAMVGDDKNPPVTSLALKLDDAQAADAVEAFEHVRLAKQKGKDWEAGRLTWVDATKTLTWSFGRPLALTPDWDAASLESTRASVMAIVKDATPATLVKFVGDVQKRATQRGGSQWDDERTTYSFNVTDSKFVELSFAKPMDGAALLKDLGLAQVTFENPCDADYLEVLTAKAEAVKVGKWELELTTTPSSDYTGSVRVCTDNEPVKPRASDKLKLTGVRLSFAGK